MSGRSAETGVYSSEEVDFYRANYSRTVDQIARKIGDKDFSEDLAQDVFVDMLSKGMSQGFRFPGRLNSTIERRVTMHTEAAGSAEIPVGIEEMDVFEGRFIGQSLPQLSEDADMNGAVVSMVRGLSVPMQQMFVLRYMGYGRGEIAEILNRSKHTITSDTAEGRRVLRSWIKAGIK